MKNNLNKFLSCIFIFLLCAFFIKIYAPWFFSPVISAGDWPYYTRNMLDGFATILPQLWTGQRGIGLGGVNPEFPIFSYLSFTAGLSTTIFNISWVLVYKTTWFGLFLLLSIISSIRLYKVVRPQTSIFEYVVSSFIYLVNSYILMIVGGGQMGIALAYAITPFVLAQFIIMEGKIQKLSKKQFVRLSVLIGLIIALQIFFEPRITYLTLFVLFFYFLYSWVISKKLFLIKHLLLALIASVVILLIHAYWIIPFFFFHLLSVPTGITSQSGFVFFSFADFSHAFSFLHPNWPANIFGKVSFLRPEFLLYPLVAFSGLLFARQTNKQYFFFAFISLMAVFMAKGTTPPFEFINRWIFVHVPGMNIFRDPTKFYFFIALAYSIMIPISFFQMLRKFEKNTTVKFFIMLFLLFSVLFPIRDAFLGKLQGTFHYTPVPKEYRDLENFLSIQNTYFRTLWVPDQSYFRYISETHPMLTADSILHTTNLQKIPTELEKLQVGGELARLSVKYIIVPDDTNGEIFLTDRKYDNTKRVSFIKKIDVVSGLKKMNIGNIVLYENPLYKSHFFDEDGLFIPTKRISSQQYVITINSTQGQKIIFSGEYNPGWEIQVGKNVIRSKETKDGLNSFTFPKGTYKATVDFAPSKFEWVYCAISLISLLIFVLYVALS